MTSDLPFDSDATEADDRAGDTAYRVATGVARVARAGAYVTGGALVATNGGPAPVHPGGQRLDSWTSAYTRDPDAGAPSPVVTFPDPDPNSTPSAPVHSSTPTPRDVSVNAPFTIPNVPNSGVYIGPVPQQHSVQPWQNTGYGNSYQPGLGLGTESERSGLDLHSDSPQSGLDLGTGHVPGGFGKLPGFDLGQGDHGFHLPDPNSFLAPGSNPFTLPRVPTSATTHNTAISESVSSDAESADDGDAVASNVPFYGGNMFHSGATGGSGALFHGDDAYHGNDAFHGADMFHGVGNPDAVGVFINAEAAFSVHTELEVDFSVGPNGMYLATQSKVEVDGALKLEVGAGRVGDNIDRFSDWLGQTPGTTGRSGLDNSGTHGTVNPVGAQPVGGSPYSAVQPVAVQPVQPFAAPLPAPIAPAVAPATVAPAVVAPAAVAAPVAATPLQTTIQPDVASTPVANVLVAPQGPSPLTAPAATVPALFEPRPVPAKHPVVVDDSHSTTTPVTSIPTTVTKTVPIPADNTTGHPTKAPDTGSTRPGHTTVPDPDISGTTKIPTATHAPTTQAPTTQVPTHTATPTTPDDDDVTLPSTGNGGGTSTGHNGGTTPSTVNGGNSIPNTHTTQPEVDDPTVDVPTVSVPTVTHSAPTVAPTPDIDIPTANSPAPIPTQQPHVPAPTMPAPVTPIKPPTHPIAAEISDPADFAHPVYEPDHAALSLMAAGLSTPLLPDPGVDYGHHLVPGLDITLI